MQPTILKVTGQSAANQSASAFELICVGVVRTDLVLRLAPSGAGIEDQIGAETGDNVRSGEPALAANLEVVGGIHFTRAIKLPENSDNETRIEAIVGADVEQVEVAFGSAVPDFRQRALSPETKACLWPVRKLPRGSWFAIRTGPRFVFEAAAAHRTAPGTKLSAECHPFAGVAEVLSPRRRLRTANDLAQTGGKSEVIVVDGAAARHIYWCGAAALAAVR